MKEEPARDEGYAIVPRWIMKDERFTVHMVMVYLALQSFSGVTGSVIPSVATLAKRARLAPSTTRTTLRALEEIGVIVTEARYDSRGDRTSNNYILLTHDPKAPPVSGAPPHRDTVYPPPEPGAKGTPSKEQEISYEISPRENTDEEWDRFWSAFPRKESKPAALRAWKAARKRASVDAIMDGLGRWLPNLALREKQYIPLPATWLNNDKWNDEPSAVQPTERGKTERPKIDPQMEWMYR